MGLRFLIGPAGSGKTRHIVNAIADSLANDGDILSDRSGLLPNILLIVPDQATFQMESRILEAPRLKGFVRLQILSFKRLAWKVLEETGGISAPFITAVGRSMAVQSILWERRKDLTVFASQVNHPGFVEALSLALQELYAYDLTPEALATATLPSGESLVSSDSPIFCATPFLRQKMQDLITLYRGYAGFLKERFLDPSDCYRLAASQLKCSSLVKGAIVYVDGFSGFTPDEYRLLEEIICYGQDVHIALCMDREEAEATLNETSLFHPTREVYEKIRTILWKKGIHQTDSLFFGGTEEPSRFRTPDLVLLEACLRRQGNAGRKGGGGGASKSPRIQAEVNPGENFFTSLPTNDPHRCGPGVHVLAAANHLTEVEFVAREILRLVRDQGYRYRDITVETRELEPYALLLPLIFKDYRIPFFLDRKRPLSHHPLAELLRSAVEIALTSFSSEAVFRYLKTDLVPVDRETVDILENYVLAHGINGERWISRESWQYKRRYLEREDSEPEKKSGPEDEIDRVARFCDAARKQALSHLRRFYLDLKPYRQEGARHRPLTAGVISRALYRLLLDLDVPGSLEKWQGESESQGDLATALEHAGLWDKVMEILEQAGEILKDQDCDLKTFGLLLEAGLENVRIGVIPPSLDQVLVGSIDRSRQPECEIAFLIGALAGSFPKRHTEDGIFTDSEREHLEKGGLALAPGSKIRQLHEKYLTYIALTRPGSRLYISYPLGDEEGKALEPSHVVGTVRRVLGGKPEILIPPIPPCCDLNYMVPGRVRGLTVQQLAGKGCVPVDPVLAEAYRWLVEPSRRDSVSRVFGALSFKNRVAPLSREIVKDLYGKTLRTSVSGLEQFAACPFSHFAARGLKLKERDIYRLEPADAGTFLHEALKDFVSLVSAGSKGWDFLSKEDVRKTADLVTERLLPEVQNEIFMSSGRYSFVASILKDVAGRAAEALTEHRRRGKFIPVALESRFGFQGGVPPLRFFLTHGAEISLRGQIDRIDALFLGDHTYLRVIDYKSSRRVLDLTDVYSGLSLQLLTYLLVALESWPDIVRQAGRPLLERLKDLGGGAFVLPGEPVARGRGAIRPAGALYFTAADPPVGAKGPVEKTKVLNKAAKALRMSGLLVDDLGVLRLMDPAESGHSDIIPVSYTKKGLGAGSKTVSPDEFLSLLSFTEKKIKEMADSILSGEAGIFPYRKGQYRACTFCPYGPLCVFDALIPGNRYRMIKPLPEEELWNRIRTEGGEPGEP